MADPRSPTSPAPRPLGWRCSPPDVIAAWPTGVPLIALCGSGGHPRWGRWSIFAAPTASISARTDPRSGRPATLLRNWRAPVTDDPLADLQALLDQTSLGPTTPAAPAVPFLGGWIGWLSYDLGRFIEPTAAAQPDDGPAAHADRPWPLLEMFRCPGAILHDAADGSWHAVGAPIAGLEREPARVSARGTAFRIGRLASSTGARRYRADVRRIRALVERGDLFQANLAHRLSARFEGAPRALARAMFSGAHPWFGALIESGVRPGELDHAIISASPELFLSVDEHRRVVSRPIKGTRPAATGPAELRASDKDRAELTMITDLMRNDLGRVCSYSTVRVDDPRAIEHHGANAAGGPRGVFHTVATVSGALRPGATHADLLRAAFPPGSVTGAPKVRAMQVIDALEPVRRGPYCGAIGFISDHGPACWNVAIRTAALTCEAGSTALRASGTLDFSVGAGIVHESDPDSEWRETLAKAGAIRTAVERSRRRAPAESRV